MSIKKDRKIALEKINEQRRRYKLALSGDAEMLILLGKKYLGQTDKPDKPVKKR